MSSDVADEMKEEVLGGSKKKNVNGVTKGRN